MKKIFEKDFILGASTAAYQIEGAWNEDGKGMSIWDKFALDRKGTVDHGDVACDHYHRYKEDVQLMKEIGIDAYRLSISWPRIFPDGYGKLEQRGIDFYNRLIDELLENGIKPFITLFHWDMPENLWEKHKGWLSRDVAKYFGEFSDQCFRSFGDRCKNWITLNEPKNVHIHAGYRDGGSAPGYKGGLKAALEAAHNIYCAHAYAVQAYRANNQGGEIGITEAAGYPHPFTDKPEDIEAAKRALEYDTFWHSDVIVKGRYPDLAYSEKILPLMPKSFEDDYKLISEKVDFLGINTYQNNYISAGGADELDFKFNPIEGVEKSGLGWPVVPQGMYDILTAFNNRYPGMKIYITENGYATVNEKDTPDENGVVNDVERVNYYQSYIEQAKRAMDDGVNLAGYFFWSLMDNLEWSSYEPRFGMIHVDYKTQKRTLKNSALWYKEFIKKQKEG